MLLEFEAYLGLLEGIAMKKFIAVTEALSYQCISTNTIIVTVTVTVQR